MRKFMIAVVLLACSFARAAEKPELWVYCPTNLQVNENVDTLEKLWKRAAAAGYTHVLLSDSKFSKLGEEPDFYFKNARRAKEIAAGLKLQIVPAVFAIGYSNDVLWHDPNLAEGLPVKDSPFIVKDGEARLEPDSAVKFGKVGYADETVHIADGVATVHGSGGHHRFMYKLALPPYRCYHVSAEIKTENYTAQPEIKMSGHDERGLNHQNLGVKPTQDWTHHDVIFNTLDNTEVTVYFGVWGETKGSLWWRNWKIEEVGLANVLRRPGTPCTVKGDDGHAYVEGKDYEPIVDPHLGNDPWRGEYKAYHTPPTIHTKLPDGTRLRVSWYHPAIIYDGQVCACISEPKLMDLLADQARRMKALWDTPAYAMSHDEFRVCNWDKACEKRHETPGQMLAENVKACRELLRPQAAYVWNDMFDPYHNAVKGPYYLVNGPWTGSWEGLDKDVVIMNWNFGERDKSLRFFADRGHRQVLAGYYDGPMSDWRKWLESAAKVQGVQGYMYTTWQNNYDHLEEFARMSQGKQ